ncbi:hypothetical protein [Pirellulimonas nuda]|uniref:hypothetical protein n=1 Tax=Pirellulimonas nuda TaxID=2528009 RepID=UPI00119E929B|nr:hypothetical protein [Pirellulimonas nuda]
MRKLPTRALLLALVALAAPQRSECQAAPLAVLIDQSTGRTYLENFQATPVFFSGYTIESNAATFSPVGWTPISGNYDAAGNGSVDALGHWIVLSAPSSSMDLSEGVVSGTGGTLAPGQVVSLGATWTGGSTAVTAEYLVGSSTLIANVAFRLNPADYNRDLVVDTNDYNLFRATFGQTIDLRADGNGDGMVNAADFTVWRDRYTPLPVILAPGFGAAVPEPSGYALAACGLALWCGLRITSRGRALTSPAVRR